MAARSTAAAVPARKTTVAKKTVATAPKKITASASKRRVVKKQDSSHVDEYTAYVPDLSVAHKYVGRKVWGVFDKILADEASANGENMLLMGDTGSGKTLFSEAYAALTRRMYYSLVCDVSIDPTSLFGRMQPTDTPGKFRWQDGPLTTLARGKCGLGDRCKDPECEGGVLNFSEINFMPPKIAASTYPLLDSRRCIYLLGHEGEIVRAHKGLLVTADMNPNYRGTMELNAAFLNRFEYKIPWGYDSEVEEKLVKFPTLRDIARRLRELSQEIQTPVSTNMLMEFESFATRESLSLEFAMNNFSSAFRPNEQEAVMKVFELNEMKLKKDIEFFVNQKKPSSGRARKSATDDDLDEMDFELEVE